MFENICPTVLLLSCARRSVFYSVTYVCTGTCAKVPEGIALTLRIPINDDCIESMTLLQLYSINYSDQ